MVLKIDLPGAQFNFQHHFTVVTNPLLPFIFNVQSTFAFFIRHSEGVEIDFVLLCSYFGQTGFSLIPYGTVPGRYDGQNGKHFMSSPSKISCTFGRDEISNPTASSVCEYPMHNAGACDREVERRKVLTPQSCMGQGACA